MQDILGATGIFLGLLGLIAHPLPAQAQFVFQPIGPLKMPSAACNQSGLNVCQQYKGGFACYAKNHCAPPAGNAADNSSSPGKTRCAGAGGGICGDSAKMVDAAKGLVQFKNGLQPGDGIAIAPQASGSPANSSSPGVYNPRAQQKSLDDGRKLIEDARSGWSAPTPAFADQQAALNTSYSGIKGGAKMQIAAQSDQQYVQGKISALKASLDQLKGRASSLGDAGRQTVDTLGRAVDQSGSAQDRLTATGKQAFQAGNQANGVYGQYQNLSAQFGLCNANPDPATAQACKTGAAGQAQSAKYGFMPESVKQAADQTASAADQARSTLGTGQNQIGGVQKRLKGEFPQAVQTGRTAVQQFRQAIQHLQSGVPDDRTDKCKQWDGQVDSAANAVVNAPVPQGKTKPFSGLSSLMKGVLCAESGGDPTAHNKSSGADGLMQMTKVVYGKYGIDPMKPSQEIPAAAQQLSGLVERYMVPLFNSYKEQGLISPPGLSYSAWKASPQALDALPYAVASYNAGGGPIKIGQPIPSTETQKYTPKVMDEFNKLSGQAVRTKPDANTQARVGSLQKIADDADKYIDGVENNGQKFQKGLGSVAQAAKGLAKSMDGN